MQTGSKLWIGLAAGLGGAQVLASALLPNGFPLIALSDLISVLLFVILMFAAAGNAARGHGQLRAFWLLQVVSWLIFLTNQVCWTYYDLVLRAPVPMYFSGDVLPFFGLAFLLFACLLRPHAQQSKPSLRRGTLDFILLMVWWFYAYSYLVVAWQAGSKNEQFFNRNYNALYLALNLVLFVILTVQFLQSEGRWKRFYGLFLCAVLMRYGAFVLENRAIEEDRYFSGSWYDCLYSGVFVLFMVLAMEGRKLRSRRSDALSKREPYGSWMAGLAILAVLSLPVVLLFATRQDQAPPGVTQFRELVTAAAMFVMAGLAFTKQFLMHQELKQANLALEESAMTDLLTGLRNRRYFQETIDADVAQTLRARVRGDRRASDLVFYLVDLDDFKQINDRFGHDAGDCVLQEIARRMKTASRESDVLVRWGGEEFLIVSRRSDRRNAEVLAQRVLDAVRSTPFAVGESDLVRLTCSVGWAAFPPEDEGSKLQGYEEVLKIADRALYRAKRSGKDKAVGMTAAEGAGPYADGDELELHNFGKP